MTRTISHTELRALAICEAQWDYRYGGTLAGDALKPRSATPRMREGRAWGRAVAAWPASDSDVDGAKTAARHALMDALQDDADEQRAAGVYDIDAHDTMSEHLLSILDHYMYTSTRLPIDRAEHELVAAVPSRGGRRASTRYRYSGFVDGIHTDADGRHWIVEFKLRATLSPLDQLALDRQGRRYAWAWQQTTGTPVAGVIYDERLNDAPKPARVLASGKVSADKSQRTTAQLYTAACATAGHDPDPDTLAALKARVWQQRHRIIFRPGELAETGAELTALARRIGELDAGRMPIRTPHPAHCRGCAYREICPNPSDSSLVDALFERVPAKRDRILEPA